MRINGAPGVLICGARRQKPYTFYSHKMYDMVTKWRPELLKTYKKQRGAIKRYIS